MLPSCRPGVTSDRGLLVLKASGSERRGDGTRRRRAAEAQWGQRWEGSPEGTHSCTDTHACALRCHTRAHTHTQGYARSLSQSRVINMHTLTRVSAVTHPHTRTLTSTHTCKNAGTHTRAQTTYNKHAHRYPWACTHIITHTCKCPQPHTKNMHTQPCVCTQPHTVTHIHVCVQTSARSLTAASNEHACTYLCMYTPPCTHTHGSACHSAPAQVGTGERLQHGDRVAGWRCRGPQGSQG